MRRRRLDFGGVRPENHETRLWRPGEARGRRLEKCGGAHVDKKPVRSLRHRFIVDRRSQVRLVLLVVLYQLIATLVTLAVILLPSVLRFTSSDLPLQAQYEASREFLFLDSRVVPVVVVLLLAMAAHFVFVTHKVFGPIARLKNVLVRWRDQGGWPPKLTVRRGDFSRELFEEFNGAASRLGDDLAQARDGLLGIAERADELARRAGPGEAEEAKRVAESCRAVLGRLERWRP